MKVIYFLIATTILLTACKSGPEPTQELSKEDIEKKYLEAGQNYIQSHMNENAIGIEKIWIDSMEVISTRYMAKHDLRFMTRENSLKVDHYKRMKEVDEKILGYVSETTEALRVEALAFSDSLIALFEAAEQQPDDDTLGFAVVYGTHVLLADGSINKNVKPIILFDTNHDIRNEWNSNNTEQ